MKNARLASILVALLATALIGAGCASLGLGRSGTNFNYDNATKIKKGMTMEQVQTLMEGEPNATGRQMNTGHTHWHYEYAQTSGAGVGAFIPGAASSSTGQAYMCDVYFNSNGRVVDFNYHTNKLGSQGAGI